MLSSSPKDLWRRRDTPARLYRPTPDHLLVKKTCPEVYSHKLPWFVLNLCFSANGDSKAGHLSKGLTSHEVMSCCQLKLTDTYRLTQAISVIPAALRLL